MPGRVLAAIKRLRGIEACVAPGAGLPQVIRLRCTMHRKIAPGAGLTQMVPSRLCRDNRPDPGLGPNDGTEHRHGPVHSRLPASSKMGR
jgi:hypothetical protein